MCDISRKTINTTSAEEEIGESIIYTGVKCYILEVKDRDFTQELGNETDKGGLLLKIWAKTEVKQGDLIDITDKDLGEMGRFRVYEVEPKRLKGRLKSIYLHLSKYNG